MPDDHGTNARRWTWALALVAAVGLVIAAVVVWGGDDVDSVGSGPGSSSSSITTTPSTTSSTTTTTTTVSASTSTTTPQTPAPAAVTIVKAGPGGGSGEVALDWDATSGATGYRILRSNTPGGQFAEVATIDVTRGQASAGAEVVNIWSGAHSYIPSGGPLTAPDRSRQLHYVEIGSGQRCFRVVAYNEGGDAPPSSAACGAAG